MEIQDIVKYIPLTKGYVASVDDADFDDLNRFKWTLFTDPKSGAFYAYRGVVNSEGKWRPLLMHRYLMKAKRGQLVDHKNGNGLDNRRRNMRFATHTQNQANRGAQRTNKLGVKGVSAQGNRFIAKLTHCGKQHYFGCYKTIAEASNAYRRAAIRFFGEYARAA